MNDKKKIVFYSYKGGTGRTLALANVASYLARFGFRVCIIDMDLEAPGIHYKFLENTDPRIKSMCGVVDYIDYFVQNEMPPPDIEPFFIHFNDNISIMPSGNVTCNGYWDKLSRIDWHSLLYEKDSSGVKLLLDLLGRILSDELDFDYVLIDARAGITPLSGLCVSLFGDMLASFFTTSPDSLDGTRQMLRNVRKTREKDNLPEIPIVSVLTRFEQFENKEEEDSFIADKKKFFYDGEQSLCTEMCVIHADRDIERNERIVYGISESPGDDKLQSEIPIQLDYLRLFSVLVDDDKMRSRIKSLLKKITDPASLINEPEKVQSEVEAMSIVYKHKLVLEELIKIYKLRNIDLLDKDKFLSTITRYYNSGGAKKAVDELYFDAFIHYYDGKPSYGKATFPFNFKRVFKISESASLSVKMQLASILQARYTDRYYKKAFELFKEFLQNDQYSKEALIRILELFVEKEDLYLENAELLPDLDDLQLKDLKNSDLRDAVYNVYIKYFLPENANEVLDNTDFNNYVERKNPCVLIETYLGIGYTDIAVSLAGVAIDRLIRTGSPMRLAELLRSFEKRGLGAIIEPYLPKDDLMVEEAQSLARRLR